MHHLGNIGFIGGGNMGNCLIGGLIHHNVNAKYIWVADHQEEACAQLREKWGISAVTSNQEVAKLADVLVLAVKPQVMREVVQEIAPCLPSKSLIISIAAGITTSQIRRWLNVAHQPIVRAMPNTPALLGQGITGLFATQAVSNESQQMAEHLLQTVGETVWVDQESLMDVITALSGSGPAYFFYLMEGLIKGAATLGLPPEIARKLTLHTALGSAKMALEAPEDIESLRAKVTSKGGTTEQGIQTLNDGKLHLLLLETLQAATLRGKALSEQFD